MVVTSKGSVQIFFNSLEMINFNDNNLDSITTQVNSPEQPIVEVDCYLDWNSLRVLQLVLLPLANGGTARLTTF